MLWRHYFGFCGLRKWLVNLVCTSHKKWEPGLSTHVKLQCKIESRLLLRKLDTRFLLVPKSTTSIDVELTLNDHFALLYITRIFFGANHKEWIKIDPYYQLQKCGILVFSNIIIAGEKGVRQMKVGSLKMAIFASFARYLPSFHIQCHNILLHCNMYSDYSLFLQITWVAKQPKVETWEVDVSRFCVRCWCLIDSRM